MKKSNIILISTITAMLALFAVGFTDARRNAAIISENEMESYKSVTTAAFSHLVLENSEETTFIQDSSTHKLSFQTGNDSAAFDKYYRIANDTLFLKSDTKIKIYGKSLHSIHLKENSKLHIGIPQTDSLQIISDGGYIQFMDTETNLETNIENLSLIATNSNFDIYSNIRVKNLNIKFKNSSLNTYNGKYQDANIHVQDNSSVNFRNNALTENSSVKKDGTSTVFLR